jgi:hypothetical protein
VSHAIWSVTASAGHPAISAAEKAQLIVAAAGAVALGRLVACGSAVVVGVCGGLVATVGVGAGREGVTLGRPVGTATAGCVTVAVGTRGGGGLGSATRGAAHAARRNTAAQPIQRLSRGTSRPLPGELNLIDIVICRDAHDSAHEH